MKVADVQLPAPTLAESNRPAVQQRVIGGNIAGILKCKAVEAESTFDTGTKPASALCDATNMAFMLETTLETEPRVLRRTQGRGDCLWDL
jgi:hypothetical protein